MRSLGWNLTRYDWFPHKKRQFGSGWCGSVDWVQACEPKGCWFDSQSGHMPGLLARSPVGGMRKATTPWCFSPHLSPSLSLSLKINKENLLKFLEAVMNTERRMPCEDKGRNLQVKEYRRLSTNHQKPGEQDGTYTLSWSSEGTDPANTLSSDLQNPELCNSICLLLSHPVWGPLSQQPRKINRAGKKKGIFHCCRWTSKQQKETKKENNRRIDPSSVFCNYDNIHC